MTLEFSGPQWSGDLAILMSWFRGYRLYHSHLLEFQGKKLKIDVQQGLELRCFWFLKKAVYLKNHKVGKNQNNLCKIGKVFIVHRFFKKIGEDHIKFFWRQFKTWYLQDIATVTFLKDAPEQV